MTNITTNALNEIIAELNKAGENMPGFTLELTFNEAGAVFAALYAAAVSLRRNGIESEAVRLEDIASRLRWPARH